MKDVVKSIDPYRCCWHCSYYVRPSMTHTVGGSISRVSTIDRKRDYYPSTDQASPGDKVTLPGDKVTLPDDYCDMFEIDPPPKL